MSKLNLKGWVDDYDKRWSIPKMCPICKGEVSKTDAIGLIGLIFVYCRNSKCRWAKYYKE